MEHGSYAKKVNFSKFAVEKFTAHFSSSLFAGLRGCGATALSLLTGKSPTTYPMRPDWDPCYMLKELRSCGFEAIKLTRCNLTNSDKPAYPIGYRQVVLASIKYVKGQASWVVIWSGKMYHNFEITELGPYELLNHPIMHAYLLRHPSWMPAPKPPVDDMEEESNARDRKNRPRGQRKGSRRPARKNQGKVRRR